MSLSRFPQSHRVARLTNPAHTIKVGVDSGVVWIYNKIQIIRTTIEVHYQFFWLPGTKNVFQLPFLLRYSWPLPFSFLWRMYFKTNIISYPLASSPSSSARLVGGEWTSTCFPPAGSSSDPLPPHSAHVPRSPRRDNEVPSSHHSLQRRSIMQSRRTRLIVFTNLLLLCLWKLFFLVMLNQKRTEPKQTNKKTFSLLTLTSPPNCWTAAEQLFPPTGFNPLTDKRWHSSEFCLKNHSRSNNKMWNSITLFEHPSSVWMSESRTRVIVKIPSSWESQHANFALLILESRFQAFSHQVLFFTKQLSQI